MLACTGLIVSLLSVWVYGTILLHSIECLVQTKLPILPMHMDPFLPFDPSSNNAEGIQDNQNNYRKCPSWVAEALNYDTSVNSTPPSSEASARERQFKPYNHAMIDLNSVNPF